MCVQLYPLKIVRKKKKEKRWYGILFRGPSRSPLIQINPKSTTPTCFFTVRYHLHSYANWVWVMRMEKMMLVRDKVMSFLSISYVWLLVEGLGYVLRPI